MQSNLEIRKELALRELARRDLKTFLSLRWERHNHETLHQNWHIDYLCKVLQHTLPLPNQEKLFKRLMINMPPSYGKTEIIARNFIAWSLGNNPKRKFFYVSYSDELCRKINSQVRDLMKGSFFAKIFGKSPQFLLDNANEFVLKEGGGLLATTLNSALTGFHAHQILIDDPIKVADMNSKAQRDRVNQNFKESILSRLHDNTSNITILMQRLGDEDLCGFLLDPKNYTNKEIIDSWEIIKLQALNKEPQTYKIGDFVYNRKANEPLFPTKHNLEGLKKLELEMGEDEFSTQYQQEPQVSEAGYFESIYFKIIPSYELGEHNSYIFVDNATSLNQKADNRAIVCVGVEYHNSTTRYVVKDCVYGIWSEEETITHLLEMMRENPTSEVFIESDGGGITLERLLQKDLNKVNFELKRKNHTPITNTITLYTASRKVSKVEKIKAIRSYYNTGDLVFLHNARGLEQIRKELFAFNPQKPFRKDDCIDALASAIAHPNTYPPYNKPTIKLKTNNYKRQAWRI